MRTADLPAGTALSDALAAKGGPPAPKPAIALFRCPGAACTAADGIQADGFDASYTNADGAQIDTVSEFSLRPAGARGIFLDFRNVLAPCAASCQKDFETLAITAAHSSVFHTNVVNPSTGYLAANGLLTIPIGATWPSRLKVGFTTVNASRDQRRLGRPIQPDGLSRSGESPARHSDRRHLMGRQGSASDRARLVSFISKRQGGNIDEGVYSMPFRVRVTVQ